MKYSAHYRGIEELKTIMIQMLVLEKQQPR